MFFKLFKRCWLMLIVTGVLLCFSSSAHSAPAVPVFTENMESGSATLPTGWYTWARSQNVWETKFQPTDMPNADGRVLRLDISKTDGGEGALVLRKDLKGFMPGDKVVVTANVKAINLLGSVGLGLEYMTSSKTTSTSVSSRVVYNSTVGWRQVAATFTLPQDFTGFKNVADQLAVSITLFESPLSLDGYLLVDDLAVLKGDYKRVVFDTRRPMSISPDITSQITVSSEIVENMGNISSDIILELPEGVNLLSRSNLLGNLPEPQSVVRGNKIYKKYTFTGFGVTTYYAWMIFYVGTTWTPGTTGEMYVYARWSGGEQVPTPIPLVSVAVPQAQKFKRINLESPGWLTIPMMTTYWQGFFDMVKRIGIPSVSMNTMGYERTKDSELNPLVDLVHTNNLGMISTTSPLYDNYNVDFLPEELAKVPNKTAPEAYMCPMQRGGGLIKEINALKRLADKGADWFFFDFEGFGLGIDCMGGLEAFTLETGLSGVAAFMNDGKRDFKDYALERFSTKQYSEIFMQMFWEMDAKLTSLGHLDPPVMMQWRGRPGHIYNAFFDLDSLFPYYAANPVIYHGYGLTVDQFGPFVRQNLLGVHALMGENLLANGDLETGGSQPDGFIASGSGISWEDVRNGDGEVLRGNRSIKSVQAGDQVETFLNIKSWSYYIFSASGKYIGNAKPCIQTRFLNAANQELGITQKVCGPEHPNAHWMRISTDGHAPEGAVQAQIILTRSEGTGRVWFDAVGASKPNLMDDESFEDLAVSAANTRYARSGLSTIFNTSTESPYHGKNSLRVDLATTGGSATLSQTVEGILPRVQYQFSGFLRGIDLEGDVRLKIQWQDARGLTLGEPVQSDVLELTSSWREFVLSAASPRGADRATVFVTLNNASAGNLYVDALDFRVDGPYVIPYFTAGAAVTAQMPEFPATITFEGMLEMLVAGSQGSAMFPGTGFQADDLAAWSQVTKMIKPYEDIITDGRPVPQNEFTLSNNQFQVNAMELNGEYLVLFSNYTGARSTQVSLLVPFGGTLSKVLPDGGLLAIQTMVSKGQLDFDVSASAVGEPRAQLFVFERNPQTDPVPAVVTPEPIAVCGDGVLANSEECDGTLGIKLATEICTRDCKREFKTTTQPIDFTITCSEGTHLVGTDCVADAVVAPEPDKNVGDPIPNPQPDEQVTPIDNTVDTPKADDTLVDNSDVPASPICGNGEIESPETCETRRGEEGELIALGYDPAQEVCSQDCQKLTFIKNPQPEEWIDRNVDGENNEVDLTGPDEEILSPQPEEEKVNGDESAIDPGQDDGAAIQDPVEDAIPNPEMKFTVCGNGKLETGEDCDGRDGLGENEICTRDCKIVLMVPDPEVIQPECGNGVLEAGEQCDQIPEKNLSVGFDPEFQVCENCQISLLRDEPGQEDVVKDVSDMNADSGLVEDEYSDDDYDLDDSGDDDAADVADGGTLVSTDPKKSCGNGERDEGESCDPAIDFIEAKDSIIRVCNYRCQFVSLVLTCNSCGADGDAVDKNHAGSEDFASGVSNKSGENQTGTTGQASSEKQKLRDDLNHNASAIKDPVQDGMVDSGTDQTHPYNEISDSQDDEVGNSASAPANGGWKFGMGGSGCQLSRGTANGVGARENLAGFVLFILMMAILRTRTRRG